MQFTAKEDIEGPIDRVFGLITDFEMYERAALRRGADVVRSDTLRARGAGMTWNAQFQFRGRERKLSLKLAEMTPPDGYRIDFFSPNLDGDLKVDLLALSKHRTRLTLALEVRPKTLSARLMVQSLKLARTNLTKRFALRVADFAKDLEDRMRRNA